MNRTNKAIAAGLFLISLGIYVKAMAPTVSFWDCGEFIASSYILGIPHPPGAPLYTLLGRIFTMFPLPISIAERVNLISPLASALTVLFVYLIIVRLLKLCVGQPKSLREAIPVYIGGIVGSLSLAFSGTFWFNATEAEVYALSLTFVTFGIWFSLRWLEKSREPGNLKMLLLIAYIFGLSGGLHLLCWLTVPTIMLIIASSKPELLKEPKLWAIGFFSMSFLIGLASGINWVWLVLSLGGLTVFVALTNPRFLKLELAIFLLFAIGYSVYFTIMIRSGLDPAIDENNPETLHNFVYFLQRKQYQEKAFLSSIFERKADFFGYQLAMFVKYFLQQFPLSLTKISQAFERITDHSRVYVQIPFIPLGLGLLGLWFHLKRDALRFWPIFLFFMLAGFGLVIYLNMPDPQPRERDYVFVGAFAAFSIWIGMGAFWVLEKIRRKVQRYFLVGGVASALLIGLPGIFLKENYHSHDRTGNYIAYDYAYNILQTCDKDALLFTNGDNDTFPLWFLQQVEGIRKDVRVINLSLLNTTWYIKQLRDRSPKVPINLSDSYIDEVLGGRTTQSLSRRYWPKPKVVKVAGLSWKLSAPKGYNILRVQDLMIIRIVQENKWKRPIYFAVTVSEENKIGLQDYLRMEGMAYRLVKEKGRYQVDPKKMRRNLLENYRYRGIKDPEVYKDRNTQKLLSNYFVAYMRLAETYLQEGQREAAWQIVAKMEETLPLDWSKYYTMARLGMRAGKAKQAKGYIKKAITLAEGKPLDLETMKSLANLAEKLGAKEQAIGAYEDLKERFLKISPKDSIVKRRIKQINRKLESLREGL